MYYQAIEKNEVLINAMDESWKHAPGNKPDMKGQMLYDSTCMKCQIHRDRK